MDGLRAVEGLILELVRAPVSDRGHLANRLASELYGKPRAQTACEEHGAIPVLIEMLECTDAFSVGSAASALANITFKHDGCIAAAVDAGVMRPLLRAVQEWRGKARFHAVRSVASLSGTMDGRVVASVATKEAFHALSRVLIPGDALEADERTSGKALQAIQRLTSKLKPRALGDWGENLARSLVAAADACLPFHWIACISNLAHIRDSRVKSALIRAGVVPILGRFARASGPAAKALLALVPRDAMTMGAFLDAGGGMEVEAMLDRWAGIEAFGARDGLGSESGGGSEAEPPADGGVDHHALAPLAGATPAERLVGTLLRARLTGGGPYMLDSRGLVEGVSVALGNTCPAFGMAGAGRMGGPVLTHLLELITTNDDSLVRQAAVTASAALLGPPGPARDDADARSRAEAAWLGLVRKAPAAAEDRPPHFDELEAARAIAMCAAHLPDKDAGRTPLSEAVSLVVLAVRGETWAARGSRVVSVRLHAVKTLQQMSQSVGGAALDALVRSGAVQALAACLPAADRPKADPRLGSNAAMTLLRISQAGEAHKQELYQAHIVEQLVDCVKHDQGGARSCCVQALGHIAQSSDERAGQAVAEAGAVALLADLLESEDPNLAGKAGRSLAAIGTSRPRYFGDDAVRKDVVPALVSLLRSGSKWAPHSAAVALCRLAELHDEHIDKRLAADKVVFALVERLEVSCDVAAHSDREALARAGGVATGCASALVHVARTDFFRLNKERVRRVLSRLVPVIVAGPFTVGLYAAEAAAAVLQVAEPDELDDRVVAALRRLVGSATRRSLGKAIRAARSFLLHAPPASRHRLVLALAAPVAARIMPLDRFKESFVAAQEALRTVPALLAAPGGCSALLSGTAAVQLLWHQLASDDPKPLQLASSALVAVAQSGPLGLEAMSASRVVRRLASLARSTGPHLSDVATCAARAVRLSAAGGLPQWRQTLARGVLPDVTDSLASPHAGARTHATATAAVIAALSASHTRSLCSARNLRERLRDVRQDDYGPAAIHAAMALCRIDRNDDRLPGPPPNRDSTGPPSPSGVSPLARAQSVANGDRDVLGMTAPQHAQRALSAPVSSPRIQPAHVRSARESLPKAVGMLGSMQPGTVKAALEAFHRCVRSGRFTARAICEAGAVVALVRLLDDPHPDSAEGAADVLGLLARRNPQVCASIERVEGIAALGRALARDDVNVAAKAADALGNVARNGKRWADAAVDAGAVAGAAELIERLWGRGQARRPARLLHGIVAGGAASAVVSDGGVPALVRLVRSPLAQEAAESCCALVVLLQGHPNARSAVVAEHGKVVLAQGLGSPHQSVVEQAARAVITLARAGEPCWPELATRRAVRGVESVLRSDRSTDMVDAGLSILRLLLDSGHTAAVASGLSPDVLIPLVESERPRTARNAGCVVAAVARHSGDQREDLKKLGAAAALQVVPRYGGSVGGVYAAMALHVLEDT